MTPSPPPAPEAAPSARTRGEEDAPRVSAAFLLEPSPETQREALTRLARQVGVSLACAAGHPHLVLGGIDRVPCTSLLPRRQLVERQLLVDAHVGRQAQHALGD